MAVSLHSSSRTKNLKKSVLEFVRGKFVGQEGLSLAWGQPGFKEEGLERWAQVRLILSTGQFQRQVDDNGRQGETRDAFLNFNLFERYPPRQNVYFIEALRQVVFEYVHLKVIPIRDYDTAGDPLSGQLRMMEIMNDREIQDGRASGLRQWNMSLRGQFLYKYLI